MHRLTLLLPLCTKAQFMFLEEDWYNHPVHHHRTLAYQQTRDGANRELIVSIIYNPAGLRDSLLFYEHGVPNKITIYRYSPHGDSIFEKAVLGGDPDQARTLYVKDGQGRLVEKLELNSHLQVSSKTLHQHLPGKHIQWDSTADEKGQLQHKLTTIMEYDSLGRLSKESWDERQSIYSYAIKGLDSIIKVKYSDDSGPIWAYDSLFRTIMNGKSNIARRTVRDVPS